MFGLIKPCACTLGEELREQWQAHMCGLCLTLRDEHGQFSRMTTNTDAIMLSILVEAQAAGTDARTTAGPCPFRGMRTASVVPSSAMSTRLGATASLALAAAKAADVAAEADFGLGHASRIGVGAARRAGSLLRRKALADGEMSDVIDVAALLDGLAAQAELEHQATRVGLTGLRELVEPTAAATEQVFAAAATAASAPGNEAELRRMGHAFGALAHLLDAVQDAERDRKTGSFNPIDATQTPLADVREECRRLEKTIRQGFSHLELVDGRLLKVVLVDGVHKAVHQAFPSANSPGPGPTPPPAWPGNYPPPGQNPAPGQYPPPGQYPGPGPTPPPGQYPGPGPTPPPGPPEPPQGPKFRWGAILPWIGVYCTGVACCSSHTNPCTGRRHDAGCSNCDCPDCCDCCDCCDGCDCCDCNC